MELHEIPEAFQSKLRLVIISMLITGDKTFSELKSITKATDGNLSVQLTKLEEWGYVSITKTFVLKKSHTVAALTERGKCDFEAYVKLLSDLITVKEGE
ncbi:MAG: transcriptional regulator [Clostridia bacterium]|nr:transcriptional regulator [Clostridia bacterium]